MLFETILSVSSFLLSLAGFLLSIALPEEKKTKAYKRWLGSIIIFGALGISSVVSIQRQWQEQKQLKHIESQIIKAIGNEAKTEQELSSKLPFVRQNLLIKALERLNSKGIIGTQVINARDHYETSEKLFV